MGRIRGHYEWDDDALHPSSKAEGGLHQNLFDDEGNLRGSARFIPDEDDDETLFVTETVYVPMEERRLSREDQELAETLAQLLTVATGVAIAAAAPHVRAWWQGTVLPAAQRKRAYWTARRKQRRAPVTAEPAIVNAQALVASSGDGRAAMSFAEAQARMLAALAAQAFSEEQLRLIADSKIVGAAEGIDVGQTLAALPREQITALLEQMVIDPSMLGDESLARLASTLGRAKTASISTRAVTEEGPACEA